MIFDGGVVVASVVEDIEPAVQWIASALVSSGYSADFSLASLRELDRFFDEHAPGGKARRNGFLSKDLGARLFALGAYMGEVIRRISGGRWRGDDKDPQAEVNVMLELPHTGTIWPVQQVMKRFANGRDDSLEHYAKLVMDRPN